MTNTSIYDIISPYMILISGMVFYISIAYFFKK